MQPITLYLGSKENSPWSLRAWLMVLQTGVDFKGVFIALDQKDAREKIDKISPSGKVPLLRHGELCIWDSLAIGEYLAETFPAARLWPLENRARVLARSISCEIHAGFNDFKKYFPFNLVAEVNLREPVGTVKKDIQRILYIWEECRALYGKHGPFLFGRFSIADAMFAPIVVCFFNYNIILPSTAAEYVKYVMALPEMQMWCHEI